MFYLERNAVSTLFKKIKENEKDENQKIWEAYKKPLGEQSKQLMEFLENKKGTIMIPNLKQYIEKKFKEDSPSKNRIHMSQDYLLEWEQEKQKEHKPSSFNPNDLFIFLTNKDARFMPFLDSKVSVKNTIAEGYEGHDEDPVLVYRKTMTIHIENFKLQEHPILRNAKEIDIQLQAEYVDAYYYQERTHILPYRLCEKVKKDGLDYDIQITLHSGYKLKINRLSGLFDDWNVWSNEGSKQEEIYAEAFKDWFLISALEDFEKVQNDYYHHSGLNQLTTLLKEKDTKNYILQYPYNGYAILTIHPTLGQTLTDFYLHESLYFLEGEEETKDVENLFYLLTLFNEKHMVLFPTEEQQIQLLEGIDGSQVSEEERKWVHYKNMIAKNFGTLQEDQVKAEFMKLNKETGKSLKQLLEENNKKLVSFLLKLAVLLEAKGQNGGGDIISDDEYEGLLKASLTYIKEENVKAIIAMALTRYQKSLQNFGIFKVN